MKIYLPVWKEWWRQSFGTPRVVDSALRHQQAQAGEWMSDWGARQWPGLMISPWKIPITEGKGWLLGHPRSTAAFLEHSQCGIMRRHQTWTKAQEASFSKLPKLPGGMWGSQEGAGNIWKFLVGMLCFGKAGRWPCLGKCHWVSRDEGYHDYHSL